MSWIWIFFSSYFIFYAQVNKVEGKKGFGVGEQDWSYVEVRPGAHMFWWLYYANPPNKPANFNALSKPLVIWVHGGPGGSAAGYGNFEEIGPYDIFGEYRNQTLVNDYNVLFIDNPVGSGFSYVDNDSAYATNNRQVANDLLECIKKFLDAIPAFKNVPTYIFGESYGAKMGVKLASIWYKAQKCRSVHSNLKGIVMGSPWISPVDTVLSWPQFLLNTGIVDTAGSKRIETAAKKAEKAVNERNWKAATDAEVETLDTISLVSDNITQFNILIERSSHAGIQNHTTLFPKPPKPAEHWSQLVTFMNTDVKQALGLTRTWLMDSEKVAEVLWSEIFKPAVRTVEELLNDTDLKVSVYGAQLDLICALPGTVKWVENMNWKHDKAWKNSSRVPFAVNNILEGYVKAYKNFKMYWVFRAGHLVANDNPYAVTAILQDLTSGQ
ncbi:retinoid-inducible serine carboxypeptidase [Microplitis demolitor]|uniref:retinoid-inducible serine carboxypeptidase n=1 Tax=Microplitis demolitor TaxID=69319 RepID=UPI0004CCC608|nr:retinoid-inducible serine carboxypeptidase [Microplitis demolitor]